MLDDKTKTDPELGIKIHEMLISKGIETPIDSFQINVSDEEKIKLIKANMTQIMEVLGLDLSNDSLMDTPKRVSKMWVKETMWGLKPENFPKCTTVKKDINYDEMVKCDSIEVMSLCEHHFQNIDGFATVAYIPNDTVLGLSKINRIVEYFSRRPQIQERLTCQIFETLCYVLNTEHVAVSINAKHYCVAARGVSHSSSMTTTSKLGGSFKNEMATRAEFFALQESQRK